MASWDGRHSGLLPLDESVLRIVCWKWKPFAGYRSHFDAASVNVFKRMVDRHYTNPHEVVCVTDEPEGIDPGVRVIQLWDDFKDIPSPWSSSSPSCFRRLRAFSEAAKEFIGPRFVSCDLDVVICGDMRPIWDRPEDFVIWGDTAKATPYNGGMYLLRAGKRTKVWDDFDPRVSPMLGRRLGYIGSDQAWIAVALGPHEKIWTKADGVYSYRNHIQVKAQPNFLPKDARIVFFHGKYDPWMPKIQQLHPWVRTHYR